jgi:hypothetical protein
MKKAQGVWCWCWCDVQYQLSSAMRHAEGVLKERGTSAPSAATKAHDVSAKSFFLSKTRNVSSAQRNLPAPLLEADGACS